MIDWDAIISANGPAVWRTLFRVLGSHSDSDECFQEVFLEAIKTSRGRKISNWAAWLQKLATSRAIDQLRRRQRLRIETTTERIECIPSGALDASDKAQEAEIDEQLRTALARLPARQAEAISLHLLNGWAYEAIATELGISINHVGVLIHRGKARLRELLHDSLGVQAANLRPGDRQ